MTNDELIARAEAALRSNVFFDPLLAKLIAALKASEARVKALEADLARAVDAMTDVSDRSMKTYRARNGRDCTIEASDGEACEIVHSDAMFGLRAALKALKGGTQ